MKNSVDTASLALYSGWAIVSMFYIGTTYSGTNFYKFTLQCMYKGALYPKLTFIKLTVPSVSPPVTPIASFLIFSPKEYAC